MSDDEALSLFRMKFNASIKKLDELIGQYNIEKAKALFLKMEGEAHKVGCSDLDGYSRRFEAIEEDTSKELERWLEAFQKLSQEFLDACDAVLQNQFRNDAAKKEALEIISVHAGIEHYRGDVKVYRAELVDFCDFFRASLEMLEKFIIHRDMEKLSLFIQDLQTHAKKIQAHNILEFTDRVESILSQEKIELKELLGRYKSSLKI